MSFERSITVLEMLNLGVIVAYIIYQINKGLTDVDLIFNYLTIGILLCSYILVFISKFIRFEEY